jgi:hypothetical protein
MTLDSLGKDKNYNLDLENKVLIELLGKDIPFD